MLPGWRPCNAIGNGYSARVGDSVGWPHLQRGHQPVALGSGRKMHLRGRFVRSEAAHRPGLTQSCGVYLLLILWRNVLDVACANGQAARAPALTRTRPVELSAMLCCDGCNLSSRRTTWSGTPLLNRGVERWISWAILRDWHDR